MNNSSWDQYPQLVSTSQEHMDASTDSIDEQKKDRRYHPAYVKKKEIRVKVRMKSGTSCIGYCHVTWPDGRTSDVINDEREFFILTDASIEGEYCSYNILTLRKEHIEFMCEINTYQHIEDSFIDE